MINESRCKVLCHNICCLIQSAHELGISATFWGQEPAQIESKTEECEFAEATAWI